MADRITRDGRVPPRDGDLRTAELMAQYLRPFFKRMEKKDSSTRALMANTYTAAITVLDGLREVEFADLAMSVFAYCRDEKFRQFSKLYEGLLELAGAAPERFVMKLHPFYNDLAAKIKRDGSLYDYAQFLGAFSKLRYTKIMKVPGMNPSVIIAYNQSSHSIFRLPAAEQAGFGYECSRSLHQRRGIGGARELVSLFKPPRAGKLCALRADGSAGLPGRKFPSRWDDRGSDSTGCPRLRSESTTVPVDTGKYASLHQRVHL